MMGRALTGRAEPHRLNGPPSVLPVLADPATTHETAQ